MAWVSDRVEPVHPGAPAGRVAAIDQGTNSIRLLVLEPDGTELARDMVITRLGAGCRPDGTARSGCTPAHDRRARHVLPARSGVGRRSHPGRRHQRRSRCLQPRCVRSRGPPPCRRQLEVITGEQEAALSFLGATHAASGDDGPFLIQDIGGGSTEFVTGTEPGLAEHAISTQMGSVRLTERHIAHDPPTPHELSSLFAAVDLVLADVGRTVPLATIRTFIAVAGTATTVQAINLGLDRDDPDVIHGSWLSGTGPSACSRISRP